jgi:hypothetical protein
MFGLQSASVVNATTAAAVATTAKLAGSAPPPKPATVATLPSATGACYGPRASAVSCSLQNQALGAMVASQTACNPTAYSAALDALKAQGSVLSQVVRVPTWVSPTNPTTQPVHSVSVALGAVQNAAAAL